MWFSTLVKQRLVTPSKYIAPRTLLLLRHGATEGPNSNPAFAVTYGGVDLP